MPFPMDSSLSLTMLCGDTNKNSFLLQGAPEDSAQSPQLQAQQSSPSPRPTLTHDPLSQQYPHQSQLGQDSATSLDKLGLFRGLSSLSEYNPELQRLLTFPETYSPPSPMHNPNRPLHPKSPFASTNQQPLRPLHAPDTAASDALLAASLASELNANVLGINKPSQPQQPSSFDTSLPVPKLEQTMHTAQLYNALNGTSIALHPSFTQRHEPSLSSGLAPETNVYPESYDAGRNAPGLQMPSNALAPLSLPPYQPLNSDSSASEPATPVTSPRCPPPLKLDLTGVDGRPLPNFLRALHAMVHTQEHKYIVTWCDRGLSVVVLNVDAFESKILPLHFKTSNFNSFSRQCNFYNFRKAQIPLSNVCPSILAANPSEWEKYMEVLSTKGKDTTRNRGSRVNLPESGRINPTVFVYTHKYFVRGRTDLIVSEYPLYCTFLDIRCSTCSLH